MSEIYVKNWSLIAVQKCEFANACEFKCNEIVGLDEDDYNYKTWGTPTPTGKPHILVFTIIIKNYYS